MPRIWSGDEEGCLGLQVALPGDSPMAKPCSGISPSNLEESELPGFPKSLQRFGSFEFFPLLQLFLRHRFSPFFDLAPMGLHGSSALPCTRLAWLEKLADFLAGIYAELLKIPENSDGYVVPSPDNKLTSKSTAR